MFLPRKAREMKGLSWDLQVFWTPSGLDGFFMWCIGSEWMKKIQSCQFVLKTWIKKCIQSKNETSAISIGLIWMDGWRFLLASNKHKCIFFLHEYKLHLVDHDTINKERKLQRGIYTLKDNFYWCSIIIWHSPDYFFLSNLEWFQNCCKFVDSVQMLCNSTTKPTT